MSGNEHSETERVRKRWGEHAKTFDRWYETFEGAVEHHVELELLKEYLPRDKDAKILDAAGGTGRITLPLAMMGYSVTLCDISPGMLAVAKQKLQREDLLNRVEIVGCDVRKLRFPDESYDFVLCWDGMSEAAKAAKELVRVTRKEGGISIFLINRIGAAINRFSEDPVCGMLRFLSIPQKVRRSRKWSKRLFRQATETLLILSREPSAKALSRHLVLYGERI